MRCDFCLEDNPQWAYKARDFEQWPDITMVFGLNRYGSKGSWAACAACRKHVDAVDIDGLIERAMLHQIGDLHAIGGDAAVELGAKMLRALYEQFFLNRFSDAMPTEEVIG